MGNLCSSESERVDKKEDKRAPEKLQDGADEALLPKAGAHVGLVRGEGSVEAGGSGGRSGVLAGGSVEPAGVASKVLENGQCGVGAGRSVCPVIVVSSSDVETAEDDDDDDDFLNSVIAVAAETTGRAISAARDVVAEIEARSMPQSEHGVGCPEVAQRAGATMSADYPGAVGELTNSRDSFGRESGNWSDSVVKSATTAAQIALSGSNFATDDFSTEVGGCSTEVGGGSPEVGGGSPEVGVGSPEVGGGSTKVGVGSPEVGVGSTEVGGIEGSVSVSIPERNSNNFVATSSTTEGRMEEESAPASPAASKQAFEEVRQRMKDNVSSVPTSADKRDGLNNDLVWSGPRLNGGEDFGSSVDTLVGKAGAWVQLAADGKVSEQLALGEASGHQQSRDMALNTLAGGETSTRSGDQIGAHEDGLESSVDAQVDFRDTRQRQSVHSNGVYSNGVHSNGVQSNGVQSNGVEESTQNKKHVFAGVPSSLEAEVGQAASELSSQVRKTADAVADNADKSPGNACTEVEVTVDNKSVDSFRRDNNLPSTFGSQENQLPDAASSTQPCDGETKLATHSGAAGQGARQEGDEQVVAGGHSAVEVSQGTDHTENTEVTRGEDTSDASFVLPNPWPQTSGGEQKFLDRSLSQSEAGVFEEWSTTSEADTRESYVKSADAVMNEAAARDIVKSIIAKAISIVCETQMDLGIEDSSWLFEDAEEETSAGNKPGVMVVPLQTSDRFCSSACTPPDLSPPPPPETGQSQSTLAESTTSSVFQGDLTTSSVFQGDLTTSSVFQGDLTNSEELLIPPVSPVDVSGEITNTHIFGSSVHDSDDDGDGDDGDDGDDDDDASIKATAWGITDKAVREAVKILAENGRHLDSDFGQIQNSDLDSFPSEDAAIRAEGNGVLPDNNTEAPTHSSDVQPLPAYSTEAAVTSDLQPAAEPQITPEEEYLTPSLSHTDKPQENDPLDIQDNPAQASPVTPSDNEFTSSSSPPTTGGHEVNSESHTRTSPPYFSKVPLFFPPLDNFSSSPDTPLIIINSPDSAGRTGSSEDLSVHAEALI